MQRHKSEYFVASGPVEEDELYEDYMAETNNVYKVDGAELSPISEYCAQIPRYDMLEDEQVKAVALSTRVVLVCVYVYLQFL